VLQWLVVTSCVYKCNKSIHQSKTRVLVTPTRDSINYWSFYCDMVYIKLNFYWYFYNWNSEEEYVTCWMLESVCCSVASWYARTGSARCYNSDNPKRCEGRYGELQSLHNGCQYSKHECYGAIIKLSMDTDFVQVAERNRSRGNSANIGLY
jgi:hypothetical protein